MKDNMSFTISKNTQMTDEETGNLFSGPNK